MIGTGTRGGGEAGQGTTMSDTGDNTAKARREADDLGIAMEIIPHETSGKATDDAAAVLGVDASLILKMMILVDKKSGTNVGVLVRGHERIDQKKLRGETGLKGLRFASPEEVTAITGYFIGGVPPIALQHCTRRIVSKRVLETGYVYGSGGSEFCAMKIAPAELSKIPDLAFADVGSQ